MKPIISRSLYYIQINVTCALLLFILIVSIPRMETAAKTDALYRRILFTTIGMCVADLIAGVLRGRIFPGANAILWISNAAYFLTTTVICVLWLHYSTRILEFRPPRWVACALMAAAVAMNVLIVSAPLNGLIFTVSAENIYARGPLIWIHWVFSYTGFLAPAVMVPFSVVERRKKIAVISTPMFTLFCAVLQTLFYGLSAIQLGIACAFLLIYILLQSVEVREARVHAEAAAMASRTDPLTALLNRRAYNERLESAADLPWVGTVFCDVNGLKEVNDLRGHLAGDEMLKDFAETLSACFGPHEIFRVSGDEFVIICEDRRKFLVRSAALRKQIADKASCGIAEGAGADILELLKAAESAMYDEKRAYYTRSGNDRRHYRT